MVYWKFLLIIFKASQRKNYAKEAVNLILSKQFLYSERMAGQLMWSRTINTRERVGCNVPCDLHMEHLNRKLKSILSSMGLFSPANVVKAGKCVYAVHRICQEFEEATTKKSAASGKHSRPKFAKDFRVVLKEITDIQVFTPLSSRSHPTFKWKRSLLHTLPHKELCKRIKTSIDQLL